MPSYFKGLSEIIRETVAENTPQQQIFPTSTEQSIMLGQNVIAYADDNPKLTTTAFRWGYSVWGIGTIIGANYPDEV